MSDLSQQKCIPCEVGGDPMKREETLLYSKDVPLWQISSNDKIISRTFSFKDFEGSLAFVNKIGGLAEKEGHHPDITINYNKVRLELTTHAVGGLTPNDFIIAAKVDLIQA